MATAPRRSATSPPESQAFVGARDNTLRVQARHRATTIPHPSGHHASDAHTLNEAESEGQSVNDYSTATTDEPEDFTTAYSEFTDEQPEDRAARLSHLPTWKNVQDDSDDLSKEAASDIRRSATERREQHRVPQDLRRATTTAYGGHARRNRDNASGVVPDPYRESGSSYQEDEGDHDKTLIIHESSTEDDDGDTMSHYTHVNTIDTHRSQTTGSVHQRPPNRSTAIPHSETHRAGAIESQSPLDSKASAAITPQPGRTGTASSQRQSADQGYRTATAPNRTVTGEGPRPKATYQYTPNPAVRPANARVVGYSGGDHSTDEHESSEAGAAKGHPVGSGTTSSTEHEQTLRGSQRRPTAVVATSDPYEPGQYATRTPRRQAGEIQRTTTANTPISPSRRLVGSHASSATAEPQAGGFQHRTGERQHATVITEPKHMHQQSDFTESPRQPTQSQVSSSDDVPQEHTAGVNRHGSLTTRYRQPVPQQHPMTPGPSAKSESEEHQTGTSQLQHVDHLRTQQVAAGTTSQEPAPLAPQRRPTAVSSESRARPQAMISEPQRMTPSKSQQHEPGTPPSQFTPKDAQRTANNVNHQTQQHIAGTPSQTGAKMIHEKEPTQNHSAPPPAKPTKSAPPSKEVPSQPERPQNVQRGISQMDTRYVNMLLALDSIPPVHNWMASFFTWILLAGFVLFPGTFTSLKNINPVNSVEAHAVDIVTSIPLFIIAFICSGIGAIGMCYLWWRWMNNYVWLTNKIFLPGLMNSLAGILSTLASVFGAQHGEFTPNSTITIIVTSASAGVCGILTLFYTFWLVRRVKKEHDREVGKQGTGRHGEGVIQQIKNKVRGR